MYLIKIEPPRILSKKNMPLPLQKTLISIHKKDNYDAK